MNHTIELENGVVERGVRMPAIFCGTLFLGDWTEAAAARAFECGCWGVDTATAPGYAEAAVGRAVRDSGIDRNEIWVTTKVWGPDGYGDEETPASILASLDRLGMDYVDMALLHWPLRPEQFERTKAAWRALARLQSDGLVRAIGVSNFDDLGRLIDETGIVPAVNQFERHPLLQQHDLLAACREYGVVPQAWSPLGGVFKLANPDNPVNLLADPMLVELARALGVTTAQLVIRWHLQTGMSVVFKSGDDERIASNLDVFGFSLDAEQIWLIDSMNRNRRGGPDPATFDGTLPA